MGSSSHRRQIRTLPKFYVTRTGGDIRVESRDHPGGTGDGDAHERDAPYAGEFPSLWGSAGGRRDARDGAVAFGGGPGGERNPKRRRDSGFFGRVESSRLSLVRAARIGRRPDNQSVPLGEAGARRCG